MAHDARGSVLQIVDLDWRGAEAEYRRAVALAPNDGEMIFALGNLLATYGKIEQAIDLTRKALVTEPLRSSWYNYLASYFLGLDRFDEAEQSIRKAIELQPTAASNHYTLALIEIRRGHAQAALEAAQQEPPPSDWRDISLALARQIGGDQAAADARLRTVVEKYADIGAYQIAQIQAARNDANATFEWLDRAWSTRDAGIGILLYDPLILKYKDDPRFAAFCRKVGLPVPSEASAVTSS
jgi:Flp pilus assembly protein TadD